MMAAWLVCAVASSSPLVLAVGVNRAPVAEVEPLEFADDDAAAAAELFGGDPRRTWLLTEPDPSSQQRFAATMGRAVPPSMEAVRRAVRQMAQQIDEERGGADTTVIIWLIGHGAVDERGQPYLALAGGRLTPLALEREVLAPLHAAHRIHVIIDACHAATLVRWRAAVVPTTAAEVRQAFGGDSAQSPRVGYLLAAAAGQKTYEWNEIRSGVFSALVRGALRGAADADGNSRVTYDEATAYITSALQGIDVPDARPTVTARPPGVEREAPLSRAEWFAGGLGLTVDWGRPGAMHVEDARGVWLTGGLFERQHPAVLWLPAAPGMVLRQDNHEWELVADATRWVPAPQPLPQGARARGPLEKALKEGMFTVPFGPSYWRGYQAGAISRAAAEPVPPAEPGAPHFRRFLPLAALPPWAATAGLAGAAAAAGVVLGVSTYQYRTTTYQRQSVQARNAMLVAGGMGLALGTAVLLAAVVAALVTGVTLIAS